MRFYSITFTLFSASSNKISIYTRNFTKFCTHLKLRKIEYENVFEGIKQTRSIIFRSTNRPEKIVYPKARSIPVISLTRLSVNACAYAQRHA